MVFHIEIKDPKQIANVEVALRILDPAATINPVNYDFRMVIEYTPDFFVRITAPDLPMEEKVWEYQEHDIDDHRYQASDKPQRLKELIRLGIITLLGKYLQKKPRWGILSAVRPTKIFHHLRDLGFSQEEIRDKLLKIYAIPPENTDLLIEVGLKQEKYFKPPQYIGIYVGIPFCPSRCRYCSFAAVPLETHQHWVKKFLEALYIEINAMRELIRRNHLQVESIYVGGGTPTSLDNQSFQDVLTALQRELLNEETIEFTVEAGRPETISVPKLAIMKDSGVTRICINPQTMNPTTLAKIGRKHSIEDVLNAVDLVKENTDLSLNMDLILGLPGENRHIFLNSLQAILAQVPDAITIHTLAPKRAASWRKSFETLEITDTTAINDAFQTAEKLLTEHNYLPYYLYRQRLILADQANIGYAKPGHESIYNIQMMEERQTIFGLGGGAVTKWVTCPDYRIVREQNPKCPATYWKSIDSLIVKKAQQTRILLG